MNIEIQNDVADVKKSLEVAATERLAQNISDWLSAPDPSINLATAREKRQENTGNWLLTSPVFLDWKGSTCSFLWLDGKAGSGKTILSSATIDHLLDEVRIRSHTLYYYFDFQDRQKQSLQNLLKSIVVQLSNGIKTPAKVLETLYKSHSRGSTTPSIQELTEAVRGILDHSPDIFLVIDALDECEERKSLLEFFGKIRSWSQAKLHVFATSRRETDIDDSLSVVATHRITLEESVVDADILTYVNEQLQHDSRLSRWPGDMRRDIKSALLEGANGMFRWVECQLDAVRECMKPAQLRRTLKSLPKTLDDTYARILGKIGEDYVEDVQRALCCLTCSFYPLAIEELAETVAITSQGDRYYDRENRLLDPRHIVKLCSGLVATTKSRRITLMGNAQIPIEEVRLAHFSVKEYLVSDRITSSQTPMFYIEERLTHELLAQLSIRYLMYCHQDGICERSDFSHFVWDYEATFRDNAAFAPYAASFWSQHLRAAQLESQTALYQDCLEMFLNPSLLTDLIRLRRPWFRIEEVTIMRHCGYLKTWNGNHQYNLSFKSVPPLHYASLLGLDHLVSMLLDKGEDLNSSTSEGTCLVAAVSGDHQSVVKLLLANGADVNAIVPQTFEDNRDYYSRTAIHEAVANRNEAITKLLLAAGADVNIGRWPSDKLGHGNDDDSNTPLQAAVYKEDRKFTRLLLDAGADPNSSAGYHGTALEYLASTSHGDTDIMEMLLNAGADPSLTAGWKWSPLFTSIVRHNLSCAELLIERGADVWSLDSRVVDVIKIKPEYSIAPLLKFVSQIRPDLNTEWDGQQSRVQARMSRNPGN